MLNGYQIQASIGDQERLMLDLASGTLDREQLATWLRQHVSKIL